MKAFHVIQNIPSPYRVYLFSEMHRQLKNLGIDFHVHFMSDFTKGHKDRPKSWHNPKMDFPYTYWPDHGFGCHHFNLSMLSQLRRTNPDCVLVGCPFDTFTAIFAPFVLKKSRLCTWTEGNTKTTGVMNGFKGWFKRYIFSQYKQVAVPGIQGRKYIELHQSLTRRKMPECVCLPNLIDETRFKPRCEWDGRSVEQTREALGVSDDWLKLCLIPARLEWYKGLLEFLNALPDHDQIADWRIVIMGQGSLKFEILETVSRLHLDERVTILEYVPYSEMPKYYAAADLFLLPSVHDHNPLTVIEALHSGLPVAISDMAGNVDEAVTDRRNGWALPVKDAARFQETLKEVFATPIERLREMGCCSKKENAQFWNTKAAVENFLQGIGVL